MIEHLNEIEPIRKYLLRIGAEARSLKSAVVVERRGRYWRDIARIKFRDGEVLAPDGYEPNAEEAVLIKDALSRVQFPAPRPMKKCPLLPKVLQDSSEDDIFYFHNSSNEFVMLQSRIIREDGEKSYVPWTYWSDKRWRPLEPDGPLPLWGMEQMRDHETVFIHEGARAARAALAIAADPQGHPWGEEMQHAAHLGWIGGAMNPARTEWSMLNRMGVKRAYIVADNDGPGVAAVNEVAKELRCLSFSVLFPDNFPVGFDLADDFPQALFCGGFYNGPRFEECCHCATWMTDLVPVEGSKRPAAILRDHTKGLWAYIEEADAFVNTAVPGLLRKGEVLNKMLAPYSHVRDTEKLILQAQRGRSVKLAYRPDVPLLRIIDEGTSSINLHVPPTILETDADCDFWLEFLEYLFVHESERKDAERWLGTIIAHPGHRVGYGLLLISETQGIGKTTLGANILAPLVGWRNCSFPSEADIINPFNEWIAHKRLAVINEIYTGHSWKSYHLLKSAITDRAVTVNRKYMPQYVVDNWCHILACSNSMRALKVEDADRRWLYPELTEKPWSGAKFTAFRDKLQRGGLGAILRWARSVEPIEAHERAPMTKRKEELIEESLSDEQKEVMRLASMLQDLEKPCALAMYDIRKWLAKRLRNKVYDSNHELKKAVKRCGVRVLDKRINLRGGMDYVIVNDAGVRVAGGLSGRDFTNKIRELVDVPDHIIPEEM